MSSRWKMPILCAALGCGLLLTLPARGADEGLQVQMLKQMFRQPQPEWPGVLKENSGLIDDSFFERIDQRIRWSAEANQVEDAIRFSLVGDFACEAIGREGAYRMGLVEAFHKAGNDEVAQGLVDNILITNPNNPLAHFYRAGYRRAQNETGGAIEDYNWCIEHNFQTANSYYFLGTISVVMDKQPEARRYFEKCLAIDPNHAQALRDMQYLAPVAGGGKDNIFSDIPVEGPANPKAIRKVEAKYHDQYFNKAEAAFRAGKFGEAEMSYEDAINAEANHADDWIYLAALHYRLGKLELGLRELRQGLTLEPKRVDGWRYVGCFYERQFDRSQAPNDLKWAKEAYKKALDLQPGDPVASMALERLGSKKPKAADS